MSILKKILLAIAVVSAALVLVGLLLPSSAHVERSRTIAASPAKVHALVSSFRNFDRWSPWADRDPEIQYLFEGPDSGEGAKLSWSSEHPQVGSGSQVITASEPGKLVDIALDFGPQGTARAFFRMEPVENGTSVTWSFDSDFGMNLVRRYRGLMFDRWIGADYEDGLANLEVLAESLRDAEWSDIEISVVEIGETTIAYTSGTSPWEADAISQILGSLYGQIGAFMGEHQLQFAGRPRVVTTGLTDDEWQFQAAVPISEMPEIDIDPASSVQIRETVGGKTVRGVSIGPYALTSVNWDKVLAWAEAHGYEIDGQTWDEYVSDPGDTPEEELVTYLHLPVK